MKYTYLICADYPSNKYAYNGREADIFINLDIPKKGRQTIYGATGNWFPWVCAAYFVFAIISGVFSQKQKNML